MAGFLRPCGLLVGHLAVKQREGALSHPDDTSPFNPLPPVVVALALLIFGVEAMFALAERGLVGGPGAVGWRIDAIEKYAFFAPILDWMFESGRWPLAHVMRFFTYPFLHWSFSHMLMVVVFLLALGKLVGEHFGTLAVLLVFFCASVVGALAYTIVIGSDLPLVGGYPAVYGLIGSYTFMVWLSLGIAGQSKLGAFQLIAILIGLQLVFGAIFGGNKDWVADLAGFATGFLLSFALVPGAIRRLRDRLRQR